jgi:hypothetical protein
VDEVVTPESVLSEPFGLYRKTALTRISDRVYPPGTVYQTPEGLKAEDEETRCAIDAHGGVYPIRESVFRMTYSRAGEAVVTPPEREPLSRTTLTRAACPKCGRSIALDSYGRYWAHNPVAKHGGALFANRRWRRDTGLCEGSYTRAPAA